DRNNNQTGGLSATQAEHNAQRAGEREEDVPSTAPSAAPTSTPTTSSSVRWAPIAAAVLVVALAAPGTARLVRRRRRLRSGRRGGEPRARGLGSGRGVAARRERVRAAWRELADSARDVGRPWSSSRTPRRAADWVT